MSEIIDVARQSSLDALGPKINSTIGTANEIALDKLIEQNKLTLRNIAKKTVGISNTASKTTIVDSAIMTIAGGSTILYSFTIESDKKFLQARFTASLKTNNTSYASLLYLSTISVASPYATLGANFVVALSGTTSSYVEKTADIILEAGVTYYIHFVSNGNNTAGECNACSLSIDENSYDITTISDVVSSGGNNVTSALIGSFTTDSYVDDNFSYYFTLLASVKRGTTSSLTAYICITPSYSTPQSSAVLSPDASKIYSFSLSPDYAKYTLIEDDTGNTVGLKPNTTYYVHLYSGSSSYAYMNYCAIEYVKVYGMKSQIVSIQRGYTTVGSSATVNVPISRILADKSFVTVNNPTALIETVLSNDKLTLINHTASSTGVNWQIIEFV